MSARTAAESDSPATSAGPSIRVGFVLLPLALSLIAYRRHLDDYVFSLER